MNKIILTITLFFGICVKSYSQSGLIGNWHRINPSLRHQDLKSKKLQKGDLAISPDSTFHIQGDTANQKAGIPGWHVGENQKGTWENKDSSHLVLWIGSKKDMMFINYTIVKLTATKLVLRISLDNNDEKNNISYVRF